ncbi:amino acid ABC transporter permease [Paenibacillus periandrae]|uniref:amino acid ABC transporter permease n=1 Tax=Paenibacillus periandrae TaxID=1761741 RepID=UPI001F095397|nr:amino acid ABC transporter permease [Paenibacillus periandrae]
MDTFKLDFVIQHIPDILKAVPITLLIALVSMALGTLFGSLIAICRTYKVPVLSQLGSIYISFFRGTPLLVTLYLVQYGVPTSIDFINTNMGLQTNYYELPPLANAFIAFTLYTTAYQAETIRSALQAVDRGQMEAAQSIGMTATQNMIRIIAPQAFISALPNMGNLFVIMIKATSVAFAVKVVEIMAVAKIIASNGYHYIEMYLAASLVYWVICLIFERLFAWLEKRNSRFERRPDYTPLR